MSMGKSMAVRAKEDTLDMDSPIPRDESGGKYDDARLHLGSDAAISVPTLVACSCITLANDDMVVSDSSRVVLGNYAGYESSTDEDFEGAVQEEDASSPPALTLPPPGKRSGKDQIRSFQALRIP